MFNRRTVRILAIIYILLAARMIVSDINYIKKVDRAITLERTYYHHIDDSGSVYPLGSSYTDTSDLI